MPKLITEEVEQLELLYKMALSNTNLAFKTANFLLETIIDYEDLSFSKEELQRLIANKVIYDLMQLSNSSYKSGNITDTYELIRKIKEASSKYDFYTDNESFTINIILNSAYFILISFLEKKFLTTGESYETCTKNLKEVWKSLKKAGFCKNKEEDFLTEPDYLIIHISTEEIENKLHQATVFSANQLIGEMLTPLTHQLTVNKDEDYAKSILKSELKRLSLINCSIDLFLTLAVENHNVCDEVIALINEYKEAITI